MRKKIVAGNWKMNLTLEEGLTLASETDSYFMKNPLQENKEVVLCTPFIHLAAVSRLLKAPGVTTGAQNCSNNEKGAYTGEVSAAMIRSTGALNVIIGHSERRSYYGETDDILAAKTAVALRNNLLVIFCCGELLAAREAGNHFDVVKQQLERGLFNLSTEEFSKCVIAYEPVWAIGTGMTATPAQAQEMHHFIRQLTREKYDSETAENTTILYGGSCKASNAAELFANQDVDGGLIGGASLSSEEFCKIAEAL